MILCFFEGLKRVQRDELTVISYSDFVLVFAIKLLLIFSGISLLLRLVFNLFIVEFRKTNGDLLVDFQIFSYSS